MGGLRAVQPRQQVARWVLLSSPTSGGETVVRSATTALLSVTTSTTPAGLLGRRPARHGYPPLNIQSGRNDVKIATGSESSHSGATTTTTTTRGSWSFLAERCLETRVEQSDPLVEGRGLELCA